MTICVCVCSFVLRVYRCRVWGFRVSEVFLVPLMVRTPGPIHGPHFTVSGGEASWDPKPKTLRF